MENEENELLLIWRNVSSESFSFPRRTLLRINSPFLLEPCEITEHT